MPKIIKSMREDSLYGSKAPKYFLDAKKVRFQMDTTIALADDGFIYQIGGETSYDGGWNARKYTSNPNAKDKTNFYEMLVDCKYTEQESQWLKTKKELIEALEAGILRWKTDPIPGRIRESKAKKKAEKKNKVEESNNFKIPFWAWIVLGVVIVFVIASL